MTASLHEMRTELAAVAAGAPAGLGAVDDLCRACVGVLGVDGASVSTVQDGQAQWTLGASDRVSRRLGDHQFTFGEGPCIDAVLTRQPVLAPDLGSDDRRWPAFAEAALRDGVHAVFALPVTLTRQPLGALDLTRAQPGQLWGDALAGAVIASHVAARLLLRLAAAGVLDRQEPPMAAAARDHDVDRSDLDRVEVYQATGILVHQLGVGPDEAVLRLRAHAMASDRSASRVAYDIIERRLFLERDAREGGHSHDSGGRG